MKIGVTAISALAVVVLFYHQDVGVNFSILGLLTWGFLHYFTPKKRKDKMYWVLTFMVFLTSISQAWYGDFYSFSSLFITLSVLGLYAQFSKLNVLMYPLIRCINFFIAPFRFLSFQWIPKKRTNKNRVKKILFLFVIPLVITSIFLSIYSTGSKVMYDFFKQLNFHIDFEMIGLAVLGWFIFFNFWITCIPKSLVKLNQSLHNDFSQEKVEKLCQQVETKDLKFERESGKITLVLLNIVLVIFIIAYNYEQFFVSPQVGNLSIETHARIYTIIISIIMAIVIILYYFKSVFNFDNKANHLKKLTYLWIIFNGILVLSAVLKITEYVSSYGLTFKRIGVYIFLMLCIIGLFYSYRKIKGKKTNVYLISKMAWSFFITFTVCSLINFSWIVTKFNLTYCKKPDTYYLQTLDYNQEIVYHYFKGDPNWKYYFNTQRIMQRNTLKKGYLSAHLYLYFLDIGKTIHEEPTKNQDIWINDETTVE